MGTWINRIIITSSMLNEMKGASPKNVEIIVQDKSFYPDSLTQTLLLEHVKICRKDKRNELRSSPIWKDAVAESNVICKYLQEISMSIPYKATALLSTLIFDPTSMIMMWRMRPCLFLRRQDNRLFESQSILFANSLTTSYFKRRSFRYEFKRDFDSWECVYIFFVLFKH